MTNKIFLDSWGFITLFNSKEKYHQEVSECFKDCINNKYIFFTSILIISETITFIYRKLGHQVSKPAVEILTKNIDDKLVNLIEVDELRMKKVLELRQKYYDKPKISFTDLSSMLIMKELEIEEIITADRHFLEVNLGFKLKPSLSNK